MRKTLTTAAACLMGLSLQACHNCSHTTNPPPPASSPTASGSGTTAGQASNPKEQPQPITLTGTLQSHPDSQGQTTWRLIGDRGAGGMRVDISHVRDVATGLDGKAVRIVGHMLAQPTGGIQTVLADSIEAEPGSATPK
ncbi:MAG TPA: hypothetical protein VFC78_22375 [Tepidisphaeraceae bacterium]|nr:hypothetical protein [Tepidisphaeraceae bacterium]